MNFSKKQLEFNVIASKIAHFAMSSTVKDELINIIPSNNKSTVLKKLNETDAILTLIVKYGSFPLIENYDNNIITNFRDIDRIFNIDELLNIKLLLEMERNIHTYIRHIEDNNNFIYKEYLTFLVNHKDLYELFNNVFNENGEVDDKASTELYRIRRNILRLNNNLDKKMQSLLKSYQKYLSESVIVTRNNRLCLAVLESYKNKVKGVIHDVSKSGQTIFIEPQASLDITASIELEKLNEEKELIKIFKMLTSEVVSNIEALKNNLSLYLKIDKLSSKAKYALEINGIKPKINTDGIVELINAKHPLLQVDEAVPISLTLNNNKNGLLITGPNTGGKTVAIKTVGLLSLMVQSGILIPASKASNFNIFNAIYADIGDEQSIVHSLSTFSSHMSHIIKVINDLEDNDLVLLDELGSGTDPNEGVSLAIAIIEKIREKDSKLIVTSHYSELKNYAYEADGINVASVAFDKKTLKPLYYLQHGISGESHARLISKRLGLSEDVIKRANELHEGRESNLAKIMAKLNTEKLELEQKQDQVKAEITKYQNMKSKYEKEYDDFVNKQERLIKEVRQKEESKWQDATKEINTILDELKSKKNLSQPEFAKIKGTISSKPSISRVETNETFKKGDKVLIKPYQQYGDIVEVKNNKYRVVFGVFDLMFKAKDLKLANDRKKPEKIVKKSKRSKKNKDNVTKKGTMRLDLRGYRYSEVDQAMDQAIDRALLSNLYSLTVIHGFGTGAVRKAVYDYINKSSHITSHRFGGEGEGLNGVTIINLK